VTSFIDIR